MNSQISFHQNYHYTFHVGASIALRFDTLEKAAKISYRLLEIASLITQSISIPISCLISQLKDLVLAIESTRFFVLFPPLIFKDKSGRLFFQANSLLKCAERVCITAHSILKTILGVHYSGLMHFVFISKYVIGNVPLFKWCVESTIWLFYFFGTWDSIQEILEIQKKLPLAQKKIQKWIDRKETHHLKAKLDHALLTISTEKADAKIAKWEKIHNQLQFDQNKAWMKIAACIAKIILITLATAFAVIDLWTAPCQLIVLSLGTLSDLIGLVRIFYILS